MPKSRGNKVLHSTSSIVTQSNDLVTARYTLSLSEQRLVLMMIAKIQPDHGKFKSYEIGVGELAALLGVARGSVYSECKKITKSLLTRVLEIRNGDTLIQTGWVSSAKYVDGSGMVSLTFAELLKPYLLELKGNFTSCRLEMLLKFKSQYTVRMYTLLKQYERLKEREIKLSQLRVMLGISVNQHVQYKNFKTNILKPIQKELTEKGDLTFEYDEIKFGRQVDVLKFRIIKQNIENLVNEPKLVGLAVDKKIASEIAPLLGLVLEIHQNKVSVLSAITEYKKKYGFDYVRRNILYCNAKAERSYCGFLSNALKNDWGYDWFHEQQKVKPKLMEIWEREGFGTQKEYVDFKYRQQMKNYAEFRKAIKT